MRNSFAGLTIVTANRGVQFSHFAGRAAVRHTGHGSGWAVVACTCVAECFSVCGGGGARLLEWNSQLLSMLRARSTSLQSMKSLVLPPPMQSVFQP